MIADSCRAANRQAGSAKPPPAEPTRKPSGQRRLRCLWRVYNGKCGGPVAPEKRIGPVSAEADRGPLILSPMIIPWLSNTGAATPPDHLPSCPRRADSQRFHATSDSCLYFPIIRMVNVPGTSGPSEARPGAGGGAFGGSGPYWNAMVKM